MADKLTVINEALVAYLGASKIATLAEASEAQRVMNDLWNVCVPHCLEKGFWKFALRTLQIDADPDLEAEFGPSNVFTLPDEFKRLYAISDNGDFEPLLHDYVLEQRRIASYVETIYIRFIDSDLGADEGNWSTLFATYVAVRLARLACLKITASNTLLDQLVKVEKRALADARSEDAMDGPARRLPAGTWSRSRRGYTTRSLSSTLEQG